MTYRVFMAPHCCTKHRRVESMTAGTIHLDHWWRLGSPLGDWLVDGELQGWFYEPSVPCYGMLAMEDGNFSVSIPSSCTQSSFCPCQIQLLNSWP